MRGRKSASLFCLCISISGLLAFAPAKTGSTPEPLRPQAVPLIINEYLADPAPAPDGDANGDGINNSTQDEFVELVNTGTVPLNISGFTISDSTAVRFTFPPATTIPPGEATVVFGGGSPTGTFGNAMANGLVFKALTGSGLNLANSDDAIIVRDSMNNEVASIDYPPPASDVDQSLTRSPDITGGFTTHLLASGNARRFSPGARINGRPFVTNDPLINSISPDVIVSGSGQIAVTVSGDKFQNGAQVRINNSPINTTFISANQLDAIVPVTITSAPAAYALDVINPDTATSNAVSLTVFAQVGINEFLADPSTGPAGDANGDGVTSSSQDEFVEIINRTSMPINIGGFSIGDPAGARLTFPPGSILPANEAAVVFGGGSPTGDFGNAALNGLVFPVGGSGLSLLNGGDTITLRNNSGNVIEEITYGSEGGMNQSLNRNPEVLGVNFSLHSTIPPGSLFSPGTLADGSPFTIGPRITEIAPDRVIQNSPPFLLSVHGSGFEIDSAITIDGIPLATDLVGADELTTTVPASVISVTGPHSVLVRNAGGNRSNAKTLTIIPPAPLLFDLLPRFVTAGGGDFTLFVTGRNFEPASAVLIEDLMVMTQFVNVSELRATVSAASIAMPGSRRVRVRNGDGQMSGERSFEVILPTSRITRLSPARQVAGSPSFTLTVAGVNFRNGANILFDQTTLATRFVSSTELQADVPASLTAVAGLRGVAAQNDDGQFSNEVVFEVFPDPPRIDSIDPRTVIEGSTDVEIAIIGAKFQRGASARVLENSLPAMRLETVFISDERLAVALPAALIQRAGKVSFRVENPDSGISNTVSLDVLIKDPLVVNEYLADPPDGAAGDANGDGSRSSSQDEFIEIVNRTSAPIDISGYRLMDSEAARHVFAQGAIIPPRESAVVFGGGTPRGRFGNAGENRLVFIASTGGLSLANGGDTIRLEDAQGRVVQQIQFGALEGGANQSINRDPDVDGAAFALHTIAAGNSERIYSPGARASGEPFTIKPSISALMPANIRAGSPSFALKVSGENFLPGVTVLFGQTQLATERRSSTELESQVTASLIEEGGAIEVRVRNPLGETSSPARLTIFDDPPRIDSITPSRTGTGAENFELMISGQRFQRGANALIANEMVETIFISRSSLAARVPDRFFTHAADLEVRIVNTDGNRSNSTRLTIENGPLITRLPRRIKAGRSDVEITIGGVGFKSGIVLLVNDTRVQTRFINDTQFSARIPAEMIALPATLTLQALNADGGRSNRASIRVVD